MHASAKGDVSKEAALQATCWRAYDSIGARADTLGMLSCLFFPNSGSPVLEYQFTGLPIPRNVVSSSGTETRHYVKVHSRFSTKSIVFCSTYDGLSWKRACFFVHQSLFIAVRISGAETQAPVACLVDFLV